MSAKITYIRNPRSGRDIKIGGKTWKMLVSNGILESKGLERNEYADIADPNKRMPLYEAKSEKIAEIAKEMIQSSDEVAKKVGITRGTQVRKIGKKLIKVSQKTSPTDMAEYTAKCASKMLNREMEGLSKDYEKQFDLEMQQNSDLSEQEINDFYDSEVTEDELNIFEEKLKKLILEEMIKSATKNKDTINRMGNTTETDFELEPYDLP